jgi:hypothetical protein
MSFARLKSSRDVTRACPVTGTTTTTTTTTTPVDVYHHSDVRNVNVHALRTVGFPFSRSALEPREFVGRSSEIILSDHREHRCFGRLMVRYRRDRRLSTRPKYVFREMVVMKRLPDRKDENSAEHVKFRLKTYDFTTFIDVSVSSFQFDIVNVKFVTPKSPQNPRIT